MRCPVPSPLLLVLRPTLLALQYNQLRICCQDFPNCILEFPSLFNAVANILQLVGGNMLDPFFAIQHKRPGPRFMTLARSTTAVRVTTLAIAHTDRTWQQAVRNLEPLHQNVLPLPQS